MFINFGVIESLNASEAITLDMYNQVEIYLKQYIDKASKLDTYGNSDKADIVWEEGNKIIYLIGLLSIIRQRILKDYQNCIFTGVATYREEYKLDCIRKTFSCFTIPFDVNPLYEIFGLDDDYGFEGIGFDAVALDGSIACNQEAVLTVGY